MLDKAVWENPGHLCEFSEWLVRLPPKQNTLYMRGMWNLAKCIDYESWLLFFFRISWTKMWSTCVLRSYPCYGAASWLSCITWSLPAHRRCSDGESSEPPFTFSLYSNTWDDSGHNYVCSLGRVSWRFFMLGRFEDIFFWMSHSAAVFYSCCWLITTHDHCCVVPTVADRRSSRKSLKELKQRSSALDRLSRYIYQTLAFLFDFFKHPD